MSFVEQFLPYCNDRYFLTKEGNILCNDQSFIEEEIIDDVKVVKLAWLDGLVYYNLSSIICILKFKIQIPTKLWSQVEAIFEDKDPLNTHVDNVVAYRFKDGPIENIDFPGYFYIPYYTRYAVNYKGNLLSIETGKLNSWLPASGNKAKNITGGYLVGVARRDIGESRHISRHRAIGLTFIRYEKSPWKLVINHKDGIPGNDEWHNLEWITRAQNNQHAYDNNLLPNKTIKVLMKTLVDNKIYKFNSVADCARFIKRSHSFVLVRLRKPEVVYSDGIIIKGDDDTEWPAVPEKLKSISVKRSVVARNVHTGTYHVFSNLDDAGRFCKCTGTTVFNHCATEKIEAIKGYNFRFISKKTSWPNHSPRHLEIYSENPVSSSGVIIYDEEGNVVKFYPSLQKAQVELGITMGTLIYYLKSKCSYNGKIYKRYKLTENLGPAIEQSMDV